jgi:two-component system, OmpR family, sensor histidine kinase CreC
MRWRIGLGLRLLFGFFVIAGIAAFFLLRVFLAEVKPSVREVMEDILIDTANVLAEQAAPDLRALPAGATLDGSRFARSVADYAQRPVDAQIWGLRKRTLDFRVYVTDSAGRLLFDSGGVDEPGTDYSRWRDVALTLRGEYGARSSREDAGSGQTPVLYVAAPIVDAGRTIGVLTVAKPVSTVQQFIDRAERRIWVGGLWLLALSLAVGVAVTAWTVHSVRTLRRYAQQARAGGHEPVPALPGELGDLAQAMGQMRDRLERRAEVEQGMRALTHELKTPLTAIGGAAELLQDELPAADRARFAGQIQGQVQRLRDLVDRLLALSKLESLHAPAQPQRQSLRALVAAQLEAMAGTLAQRRLQVRWLDDADAAIEGDAAQLTLAISNLMANAADFAPDGSTLDLAVQRVGDEAVFTLRDHGPGVPDYAWPRLGERFFSTPRPRDGARGTGLGLAIVRQVAALHGGRLVFQAADPGLRAQLHLPAAR